MHDETKKTEIKNKYSKYIPASEDLTELLSNEHISLEFFIKLYVESVEVNLDEEILWPYNFHYNLN